REAIDKIKPDVIIAIDDDAQKLAAMKYVNDPNINIVFAGINGSIKPYGYRGATNVTGILERKPVAAIREVVQFFTDNAPAGTVKNPKRPRVTFLADSSHSTDRDAQYMATHNWNPVDYKGVVTVSTFDEWKKAVKGMKGKTDFLLVGGYRKLHRKGPDSKFVPAEEVMGWTEANAPVVVLGINVFNTEDGAMLSVGVSPYEQGEVASQMALKIVKEGVSPKTIPIRTSSQYVISMRRSALERRKIDVPQIFEAFARATNNYFQ
ncbi:MAG: ABC transporter substrate binding protein, partial [Rhodospirillales bacterium]